MADSSLPATLRAGRLRRRLTQAQAGRLLNPPVHGSIISRYESGLRPPPATLEQLAKLFELELTVSAHPRENVEAVTS